MCNIIIEYFGLESNDCPSRGSGGSKFLILYISSVKYRLYENVKVIWGESSACPSPPIRKMTQRHCAPEQIVIILYYASHRTLGRGVEFVD